MEIKSKFEENNEVKPLKRPFIAVHKPSGNVYLFQKSERVDNSRDIAILITLGENGATLGVGQETETTLMRSPDEWRVVLNPTITVTEG